MSCIYDAAKNDKPITEDAIASNPDLAKPLQTQFSNFWLLSEPDGK